MPFTDFKSFLLLIYAVFIFLGVGGGFKFRWAFLTLENKT